MDDTQAELRSQVAELLESGLTKRAIATAMDVQESWLGRWLAGDEADVKVRPISVPEMDRFKTWRRGLLRKLQKFEHGETQRSDQSPAPSRQAPDAAESPFREKRRTNGS